MNADQIMLLALEGFESSGVEYMLVGSLASNLYGVPRATQDMDFVIRPEGGAIQLLAVALAEHFEREPQTEFETITGTIKTLFLERESRFELEVFHLSEDPYDQERFSRRVSATLFGRETKVQSPEDVLVTKLLWLVGAGRRKDEADALNLIAVQQDALDWGYIEGWCRLHGSLERLSELRAQLER